MKVWVPAKADGSGVDLANVKMIPFDEIGVEAAGRKAGVKVRSGAELIAKLKEEEVPIFRVADCGLVADLVTAVPERIEKL